MVLEFLHNLWLVSTDLALWLLIGLLLAGLLHVLVPAGFIHKHLGKGGFGSTLKSVLLGVPVPLCSCGVIPTAIGLRKDGASRGASVGFLISTPQTGVDSIAVSASFLGWPFALFKLFSAFVTGIIGGAVTDVVAPEQAAQTPPEEPSDCAAEAGAPATVKGRTREVFAFAIDDLLYMIWRYLVIGVLISAAITTWVPADAFAGRAWATGFAGMLVMLVISLPWYVCATSSVPIAAALVHAGLPPGAAIVFLMAGPATNVATVGAVWRAFGKRVLATYLGVIIGGSLLFGWVFNSVLSADVIPPMAHEHTPGWPATVAAVILVALLVRFIVKDIRYWIHGRRAPSDAPEEVALTVKGMTCDGCVSRVEAALLEQQGVVDVSVDLDSGRTVVRGQDLAQTDFPGVIRQTGYEVI